MMLKHNGIACKCMKMYSPVAIEITGAAFTEVFSTPPIPTEYGQSLLIDETSIGPMLACHTISLVKSFIVSITAPCPNEVLNVLSMYSPSTSPD